MQNITPKFPSISSIAFVKIYGHCIRQLGLLVKILSIEVVTNQLSNKSFIKFNTLYTN